MTDVKQKIPVASCLLATAVAVGAAMALLQLVFSVDIVHGGQGAGPGIVGAPGGVIDIVEIVKGNYQVISHMRI